MRSLAVLLLSLASSLSQASNSELQQLELLSYRLSSSFATYIFFEGQQEYLQQAKQHLQQGSQLLASLPEQHPDIRQKWQTAQTFIADNENRSFEGFDMTLEAGWSLLTLDLQEKIAALNPREQSSPAFRLRLELEQILVHYMKFANSTTGGYGVSRASDTIEDKVARAEAIINQSFADNSHLKRKWNYIKKTILAYNSNTAPYIVMRVFDDMRLMISRSEEQQTAAN
ncbi:hypothetical protein [Bacterioplanoides sp.]|uniref:hypothetical protein n=1 Tax=Bacterioplanoides sp. TaxID=2066072 RepID=UPI003B59F5F1